MTRNCRSSLLLRSIGSLGLFGLVAFALGCNGAQLNVPPPYDAGPPCESIAPVYSDCDAGGAILPTMCAADQGSTDENVARIPPGSYPQGCAVQFYFNDNGGGCAPAQNSCTCLPGSYDGGGDAEVPGQWSNCSDAGQSLVQ